MRRAGLIVDGASEYYSLPLLYPKFADTTSQIVATLRAPIPPLASAGVIANSCQSRIDMLARKGVSDIIVLLDREDRTECPGGWASAIRDELRVPTDCRGIVVVKDRMLENWLVADLAALQSSPRRYVVNPAVVRRVGANAADSCDALRLLKDVTQRNYDKVADSKKIMGAADPYNIAANSRSFRRLMRVLGSSAYRNQSITPSAARTV